MHQGSLCFHGMVAKISSTFCSDGPWLWIVIWCKCSKFLYISCTKSVGFWCECAYVCACMCVLEEGESNRSIIKFYLIKLKWNSSLECIHTIILERLLFFLPGHFEATVTIASLDNFCCCCCLVAKLCLLTLWDPVDYSTWGFTVLHHLLEFAWVHVHWVGDAV